MNNRLYKDAEPADTIYKIKSILSRNRIFVDERTMEGFDGVFSARVLIDNLDLGTNGKGASKEAALASAYAELMERIQNFALYKYSFPAKEHLCNAEFYYAPDEKAISYDEYIGYTKRFKDAVNTDDVTIDDLTIINTKYERDNNVVLCVPYINYDNNESVFFPARLSEHIYASNGMAAGNTYTEALVQSISELFERYANKVIFEGKVIPPEIKIEDIPFSPELQSVISRLKKKESYVLMFRDCSLGMGLPVVGMYFINKSTGKYFVKFGCHPILSIAAERTITELFQGRNLAHSDMWLNAFTFGTSIDADINFENIFRNGDGTYPYNIFSDAYSYEFSNCWYKADSADNKMFLDFLLGIIRNNNWNLYHRDVSFLGFPSLHAFIPEISNIAQINKLYLSKQRRYNSIKKSMKRLPQCSKEEQLEIIDFIDSNFYTEFDTIHKLLGLPLSGDSSFNKTNNLCFKYLLCCKAEEYAKGIKNLDKYMKELFPPVEMLTLYRCLREATYALHINKMGINETKHILNMVFGTDVTDRAISILLQHTFETFDCFECGYCISKNTCFYPRIIQFDSNISTQYSLWKNC